MSLTEKPNMTLDEKKFRLKYFYMIDVDRALSSVKASTEYTQFCKNREDSEHTDNLLHKIFREIFDSAKPYTSYIDTKSPQYNAFFGYPSDTQERYLYEKRLALLQLCLRNHCITHGLFTALRKQFLDTDHPELTKLSGARDNFNKTGFFSDSIYIKAKHKPQKELRGSNTIYQTYNSAYHSFQQQQSANYYSHALIKLLAKEEKQGSRLKVFFAPVYIKNVIYTLFREPDVNTFNRALASTSTPANFFKQYLSLYETYNSNTAKLDHKCDLLIYKNMYEYFYGFSLINYICNLLTDIHTSATDSAHITPKDLEGQAFLNILSKVIDCPMVFARSFLLKHVYETIIHTDDIQRHYLSHDRRSIVSTTPPRSDAPKSAKIYTALKLMDDFFSVVNTQTIPILEDFWDIIIYELDIIGLTRYEDYIKRHYSTLTFDYFLLSKEELSHLVFLGYNEPKEHFLKSSGIADGHFDPYIEQILINPLDEGTLHPTNPIYSINDLPSGSLPLYVRTSIQSLLKSSLSAERFHSQQSSNMSSKLFVTNPGASAATPFDLLKDSHAKQLLDFITS